MNDKVKLLTGPQLVQQQPSTPIFFWPQRLIACSARLAPLLFLTPHTVQSPATLLHLTKSQTPTQPLCTGSHNLQLNFGDVEGDDVWFRKQVINKISF